MQGIIEPLPAQRKTYFHFLPLRPTISFVFVSHRAKNNLKATLKAARASVTRQDAVVVNNTLSAMSLMSDY
jgi:hypothetical protein